MITMRTALAALAYLIALAAFADRAAFAMTGVSVPGVAPGVGTHTVTRQIVPRTAASKSANAAGAMATKFEYSKYSS